MGSMPLFNSYKINAFQKKKIPKTVNGIFRVPIVKNEKICNPHSGQLQSVVM